jgi:hypothetical protein
MFTHMSAEERKNFDPLAYLVAMRKAAGTLHMKKRIKALTEKYLCSPLHSFTMGRMEAHHNTPAPQTRRRDCR